ncbi:hypothetical protein LLG88_13715 [bacterium]|nr:hypothetical protein [bacterium]
MPETAVGVIGVPCAEQGRWSAFWGCLCDLERPAGWRVVPGRGSSVSQNRNLIVRRALELGAEHIFFLDDDLVFQPDVLTKMLERGGQFDAVVGLSLRRMPEFKPIWFHANQPRLECMMRLADIPTDGSLVQLAAATSGGLLVRTDVFRRIDSPWWTLGQFKGREDEWCDDLDFCRKLYEAGIPLYGDPTIRFGHITNLAVWPTVHGDEWLTALARGPEVFATFREDAK